METKIQKLLQLTPEAYEMKVLDNYINWCKKFEYTENDVQRMLTSPALFNWWLAEYRKFEHKFLILAEPYKAFANKEAFAKIYNQETMQIHKLFSKPLVYCAKRKRQHIEGDPQLN